jgi:hypothetical protein
MSEKLGYFFSSLSHKTVLQNVDNMLISIGYFVAWLFEKTTLENNV